MALNKDVFSFKDAVRCLADEIIIKTFGEVDVHISWRNPGGIVFRAEGKAKYCIHILPASSKDMFYALIHEVGHVCKIENGAVIIPSDNFAMPECEVHKRGKEVALALGWEQWLEGYDAFVEKADARNEKHRGGK